jgi:hypothetical protein
MPEQLTDVSTLKITAIRSTTVVRRAATAFLGVCIFAMAAEAQPTTSASDRSRDTHDVRSVADDNFDFVDLADSLDDQRIRSATELADALREDDACGRYRDGYEGSPPKRVCALLLHVYQNSDDYWYVFIVPVLALEVDSSLRHTRPLPRRVLSVTSKAGKTVLGLVEIATLLPRSSEGPRKFDGSDHSWFYSHTLVLGKQANDDHGLGIPETYFDPDRYRNAPRN